MGLWDWGDLDLNLSDGSSNSADSGNAATGLSQGLEDSLDLNLNIDYDTFDYDDSKKTDPVVVGKTDVQPSKASMSSIPFGLIAVGGLALFFLLMKKK